MILEKILKTFSDAISPSKMADSVRNSVRITAFSATQSLCFLDMETSPTALQRGNLVTGRRIFLPELVKAMSVSIGMTVIASINPARAKALTDYPIYLLPTDVCANVSCTLTGVVFLVSMAIFGKSLHTRLNFLLVSSLVRMRSWI